MNLSRYARARNTFLLTGSNYAALLLGFLTQLILIRTLGVGSPLDAFYAAMLLPALVITVLNNVQRVVLIPAWSLRSGADQDEMISGRVTAMLLLFSLTSLVLTLSLAGIGVQTLSAILPGFRPHAVEEAVRYFDYVVWQLPLSVPAGTLTMYLSAREDFGSVSFAALFVPVCTVLSVLLFLEAYGLYAMAGGLIVGSVLQLLFLFAVSYLRGFHLTFTRDGWGRIGAVLRAGAPVIVSSLVGRLPLIIEKAIASMLGPGAITILELARKISASLVQGVANLNIVSLPEVSRAAEAGEKGRIRQILSENHRIMMMCFAFLSIGVFLAGPDILVILTGGRFEGSGFDIRTAFIVLGWMLAATMTGAFTGTISYLHYAFGQTGTTLAAGATGVVVMFLTAVLWYDAIGIVALPGSILLQNLSVALMLSFHLIRRRSLNPVPAECVALFFKTSGLALASAALGGLLPMVFSAPPGSLTGLVLTACSLSVAATVFLMGGKRLGIGDVRKIPAVFRAR